MTEGSVFYDPNFSFHDGEVGQKLFVLLNNGQDGSFLTVLSTSKQKRKSGTAGCHASDFPINYHFPAGTEFPDNSWLLLDEIYEFACFQLVQKVKQGLIAHKQPLSRPSLLNVLDCAIEGEDISLEHHDRLVVFRTALKLTLE